MRFLWEGLDSFLGTRFWAEHFPEHSTVILSQCEFMGSCRLYQCLCMHEYLCIHVMCCPKLVFLVLPHLPFRFIAMVSGRYAVGARTRAKGYTGKSNWNTATKAQFFEVEAVLQFVVMVVFVWGSKASTCSGQHECRKHV